MEEKRFKRKAIRDKRLLVSFIILIFIITLSNQIIKQRANNNLNSFLNQNYSDARFVKEGGRVDISDITLYTMKGVSILSVDRENKLLGLHDGLVQSSHDYDIQSEYSMGGVVFTDKIVRNREKVALSIGKNTNSEYKTFPLGKNSPLYDDNFSYVVNLSYLGYLGPEVFLTHPSVVETDDYKEVEKLLLESGYQREDLKMKAFQYMEFLKSDAQARVYIITSLASLLIFLLASVSYFLLHEKKIRIAHLYSGSRLLSILKYERGNLISMGLVGLAFILFALVKGPSDLYPVEILAIWFVAFSIYLIVLSYFALLRREKGE